MNIANLPAVTVVQTTMSYAAISSFDGIYISLSIKLTILAVLNSSMILLGDVHIAYRRSIFAAFGKLLNKRFVITSQAALDGAQTSCFNLFVPFICHIYEKHKYMLVYFFFQINLYSFIFNLMFIIKTILSLLGFTLTSD